jgi:flagellar secretion chaperone FliS
MSQDINPYLRDAVLTASREQLQLMLYDGAIRFTRQGIKGLEDQDWEQCFNGFNRAQRIVLELLNGLNHEVDRELCSRMAGIYNFIYRKLVEACSLRNAVPANDALGLLEFQRETWVLLMEKLKQEQAGSVHAEPAAQTGAGNPEADLAEAGYGTLCVEG